MLRNIITLLFCAFILPGAMAVNNVSVCQNCVIDDDDDDDDWDDDDEFGRDYKKDRHPVGISRPVVVCRNISGSRADVVVKVRLHNNTRRAITGVVEVEIEDRSDRKVAVVHDKVTIPAGRSVVSRSVAKIRKPRLYSSDRSYRYEAEAEFHDLRGKDLSRETSTKFVISNKNIKPRRHPGNIKKRNPGRVIKTVKADRELKLNLGGMAK